MDSQGIAETVAAADSSELERLVIDPAHSSVAFSVRHMVLSTLRGRFTRFSGDIAYDRSDISHSLVNVRIDAASVNTDHGDRDSDLRGANFLNVQLFPEITFASKEVKSLCKGYLCIGDLTLRGVTREVEIPFEITGRQRDLQGKERLGFDGALAVNREDFGISFHPLLANGGPVIAKDIKIELSMEAVKSQAQTSRGKSRPL